MILATFKDNPFEDDAGISEINLSFKYVPKEVREMKQMDLSKDDVHYWWQAEYHFGKEKQADLKGKCHHVVKCRTKSLTWIDFQCEFTWLMNCEFRGWIPGSILEIAMPQAQIQFVACVRELAKTL